jgi:hypothetical protein
LYFYKKSKSYYVKEKILPGQEKVDAQKVYVEFIKYDKLSFWRIFFGMNFFFWIKFSGFISGASVLILINL